MWTQSEVIVTSELRVKDKQCTEKLTKVEVEVVKSELRVKAKQ